MEGVGLRHSFTGDTYRIDIQPACRNCVIQTFRTGSWTVSDTGWKTWSRTWSPMTWRTPSPSSAVGYVTRVLTSTWWLIDIHTFTPLFLSFPPSPSPSLCFSLFLFLSTPLPFGRICFVVLVMRKGGESSWSGPWHVGCTLEVSFSMCTATRTSSYSPVGPSVFYLA